MNEVRALIGAFDAACARGERCAMATVVSVEGSSYRRPGARMLISEGGTSTGTISAGCLESDVVEHANRVIRTGASKLIEYNTAATSEEMPWGLGLGCNGVVRVLIELLDPDSLYIETLRRCCEPYAPELLVATVYEYTRLNGGPGEARVEIGARLIINEDGEVSREKLSEETAVVLEANVQALSPGEFTCGNRVVNVECGAAKVFIETLLPPVSLVIFGAGHDALPIVDLACGLGWLTEVVDPQSRHASLTQFARADKVTLSRPEEVAAQVTITPRTLTLLMSHNFTYDLILLRFLLASPASYIGVMGPRQRTERMLSELMANGETSRFEQTNLSRLHSPAGLDIGANSPAEIALSIVAEMRAVLDGRRGGMLRERRGSIHGSRIFIEADSVAETRALTLAVA